MTPSHMRLLAAAAVVALTGLATSAAAQGLITTPRAADGKPDLSGYWSGGNIRYIMDRGEAAPDLSAMRAGGPLPAPRAPAAPATAAGLPGLGAAATEEGDLFPSRRCAPNQVECDERKNQSIDGEFTFRGFPNQPLYKPEFWDRVQYLDMNTNKEDPVYKCQSLGIPRMGPPTRIVQMPNEIILFYAAGFAFSTESVFRTIPTDGRPHDPIKAVDITFLGDSVAKWEGDTLVIDTVGFNDETWLKVGGLFSTDQKHVIERLSRDGDVLTYDVTVDDPGAFLEPWKMDTLHLPLNRNPQPIAEATPCKDYDSDNMVNQIRH